MINDFRRPGAAPSRDVLFIEGAPHDRLFPRMSAVVHHGGSGSTGAGLRAGRPSLSVLEQIAGRPSSEPLPAGIITPAAPPPRAPP
ncbi:hypothetical protein GCM10028784_31710 [Myceligenerans cantabricum]